MISIPKTVEFPAYTLSAESFSTPSKLCSSYRLSKSCETLNGNWVPLRVRCEELEDREQTEQLSVAIQHKGGFLLLIDTF
jgi:hypothetical protein